TFPDGRSGYDEFGNRWRQRLTAGTGNDVSHTYDTTTPSTSHNRITTTGYSYDVAGNLLTDDSGCSNPCWQYDALGQLIYNQGDTYSYDAIGNRVEWVPYGGNTQQEDYFQAGGIRDTWYGAGNSGSYWSATDGGVFTYNFGIGPS